DAVFSADSNLTFVSQSSFRNITLADGITVTVSAAGTAGAAAHVYDIGTGSMLTWSSQNFTAAGNSFTKSGSGTWNIGAISNVYAGDFTLNDGTIIVTGNNSLGSGTLTINGGTIQTSGTRLFTSTHLN